MAGYIEAFLKESGMPPTVFGRAAVRDPRLVGDLRGGREPGPRLKIRVEHFMNKWRAERVNQCAETEAAA